MILLALLLKNKQSSLGAAPAHIAAQLLFAGLVALPSYKRPVEAKHAITRHEWLCVQ
jgi:hypothetical protein